MNRQMYQKKKNERFILKCRSKAQFCRVLLKQAEGDRMRKKMMQRNVSTNKTLPQQKNMNNSFHKWQQTILRSTWISVLIGVSVVRSRNFHVPPCRSPYWRESRKVGFIQIN